MKEEFVGPARSRVSPRPSQVDGRERDSQRADNDTRSVPRGCSERRLFVPTRPIVPRPP